MVDEITRLLKQAEEGDQRAVRRLVKRVRAGDEALLQALREARREARPEDLVDCTWSMEDREALAVLMDLANRRPEDAWKRIDAARNRRSGACYQAQVLGTEAQVLRNRRRFAEAEKVLDRADQIAGRCRYAQVDLKRRRGILRMSQGRFAEAILLHSEALHDYEDMAGPGHDVRGNGVAMCLCARGEVFLHSGEYEAAVADWRRALTLLSPKLQKGPFVYTCINLAWAMKKAGLQAPAEELSLARQQFQGSKEASIPRAVLYWLDGQLLFASGDSRRRSRWRDFMILARDDFIELKRYHEATAVASDIFLSYLEDRKRLPIVFSRTVELMAGADAAVRRQLEKIRSKIEAEISFRYLRDLESAILEMRELVADKPGVMPRLISSPLKP